MMRCLVAGFALALSGGIPALSSGVAAAADNIDEGAIDPGNDYHSYANIDQFRVAHLEMDLRVWIVHGASTSRSLDGFVVLEVKRLDPSATELVLDTKGLMISEVSEKATDLLGATSKDQTTWVSRPFHMGKSDPILGAPLVIELPASKKTTEIIKIDYESTDNASGLEWLDRKKILGLTKPFLYTRSQGIGARSWIPLQDTPLVRVTYSLRLHSPPELKAVMSAESDLSIKGRGEYLFAMSKPTPAWSIALAVGDFKYRETGPRSGVYADKSMIDAAAKSFAGTEATLQAEEKLFGTYRWSRFDVVVMPPNYPTLGAAAPRLAFVSPTVVGQDDISATALAREIAHAWAGNLVSNATWRDLWLNEGIAAYMESRTTAAMFGAQRAEMQEAAGLKALRAELANLKPADQVLAVDLRGRDPMQGYTAVPYEKGRLFMNFLDAKFGREHFDAFLRGYFDHFAFKSVSTEQFLKYLQETLLGRYPGVVTSSEVDQWVNGPGIPAFAVLPPGNIFQPVDEARAAYLAGKLQPKQFGADWVSQQWAYFFDNMPGPMSTLQLAALDKERGFSKNRDGEIESSWLSQVIAADYRPGFPQLEEFLGSVGEVKLITPLYVQLMKTESGETLAKRIYKSARPTFQQLTVDALDPIVDLPPESSE
jgi:leukotriene-A4 hydrolase